LVVILAETRGGHLTFDNFRKNLLEVFDADLALCVAENADEDRENPYYAAAKHIWTYPEPEDWAEAFDEAQRTMGGTEDWRLLAEIRGGWLGGIKLDPPEGGAAAILLFFRHFLKLQLQESGLAEAYDRFIITRADFMHLLPHPGPELLPLDYIWIPRGQDYAGYNDRQIILSREDLLPALSLADDIFEAPSARLAEMRAYNPRHWSIEACVKFHLDRAGLSRRVRRHPCTMFLVRAEHGKSSSGIYGEYDAQMGYAVKYPAEYLSYERCRAILGTARRWSPLRWRLTSWVFAVRERAGHRLHALKNAVKPSA
ncbi:MAG: hypothetical protein AAGI70_12975, partial [Pseudomonadota bacterium]